MRFEDVRVITDADGNVLVDAKFREAGVWHWLAIAANEADTQATVWVDGVKQDAGP